MSRRGAICQLKPFLRHPERLVTVQSMPQALLEEAKNLSVHYCAHISKKERLESQILWIGKKQTFMYYGMIQPLPIILGRVRDWAH
jgi:hypothetical protein